MKTHMLKISRGVLGGGMLRGSLCGRLNLQSSDGMNITDKPREVTCAFCRRFNLKVAAETARKREAEFNAPSSRYPTSGDSNG